jgi:hypothetical protein
MVQVRRDLGALLPLAADLPPRHFAMDAFEFANCAAELSALRADFSRLALR